MKLRARLGLTVLVAAIPVVAGMAWLRARFEWKTAEQGLVEFALERMESGGRETCEAAPEEFPIGLTREHMLALTNPLGPEDARDLREPRDGRPPRMRPDALGRPLPERPARAGARPFDALGAPGPLGAPGAAGRLPRNEIWAYAGDFRSANPLAPTFPRELKDGLDGGARVASMPWDVGEQRGIMVAVRMPWDEGPCSVVIARRAVRGPPGAVTDLVLGSLALCAVLLVAVLFAAGPVVERVRKLTGEVRQSADARYSKGVEVQGADEIGELARTFNAAAGEARANLESLQSRERALRTFVENTTHDVMIPLTVLQGHLTVLRRKAEKGGGTDPDVIVDALQEAHYMASLVQNLATAARLEEGAGELVRLPVDLNALVERAVGRHKPIALAKQIELGHAVPPEALWTSGDVTLIEQALSNLIHNAVRYVEPGGHVAVVLEERRGEAGAQFVLRVLDDGPGIPEELRQRVFERSFRADEARSRHPTGTGLGLSITQDVALRHGFELSMRRPEAGGLEVSMTGPSVAAPERKRAG